MTGLAGTDDPAAADPVIAPLRISDNEVSSESIRLDMVVTLAGVRGGAGGQLSLRRQNETRKKPSTGEREDILRSLQIVMRNETRIVSGP